MRQFPTGHHGFSPDKISPPLSHSKGSHEKIHSSLPFPAAGCPDPERLQTNLLPGADRFPFPNANRDSCHGHTHPPAHAHPSANPNANPTIVYPDAITNPAAHRKIDRGRLGLFSQIDGDGG